MTAVVAFVHLPGRAFVRHVYNRGLQSPRRAVEIAAPDYKHKRWALEVQLWKRVGLQCVRMHTTVASETNESLKTTSNMFAQGVGFTNLGVSELTSSRLSQAGIHTPTNAQASLVPVLLHGLSLQTQYAAAIREYARSDATQQISGDDELADMSVLEPPTRPEEDVDDVLMFGAETGCGKTLAYLMPYIEASRNSPIPLKAIILVPSRELCNQTAGFLKHYFEDVPRHIVLAGGNSPDVADMKGVQMIIATPGALLNHLRFNRKADNSDKLIVIDEADMLLTGSFLKDIERILDQPGMKPFATRRNASLRAANANRLLFVGATFPHWTGDKVKSIVTWMKRRYPSIRTVQTNQIHRRNSQLQSRWFHLPSELGRIKKLADILRHDVDEKEKVMVFCETAEIAQRIFTNVLDELGPDLLAEKFGGAVELHKLIRSSNRVETLHSFRSGEKRLMVCTDLASRGLDLGNVTRVVEFDFSTNVVGYLHRIGRTARAGADGMTDHFYDDVSRPLAEAVREKAETEDAVVASIFSRNRSFRKKLKKKSMDDQDNEVGGNTNGPRSMDDVEIDEIDDEERERWNK